MGSLLISPSSASRGVGRSTDPLIRRRPLPPSGALASFTSTSCPSAQRLHRPLTAGDHFLARGHRRSALDPFLASASIPHRRHIRRRPPRVKRALSARSTRFRALPSAHPRLPPVPSIVPRTDRGHRIRSKRRKTRCEHGGGAWAGAPRSRRAGGRLEGAPRVFFGLGHLAGSRSAN